MSLESGFEQRLRDSIRSSIALGYNPNRFTSMLDGYGGVGVAKRLVASGELQDGIKKLVAMGRPELSMESIMLEPQFATLFTECVKPASREKPLRTPPVGNGEFVVERPFLQPAQRTVARGGLLPACHHLSPGARHVRIGKRV